VYCAKTAELIEMLVVVLTLVDLRNHLLDGGQVQTNAFAAARGDESALRQLLKLLWALVYYWPAYTWCRGPD